MESHEIEAALEAGEKAVAAGQSLSGTGFWGVVTEIKERPELADRYAERIAAIDQAAFGSWALLVVPIGIGTMLATVATVVGLGLVSAAYWVDGWWAILSFFAGVGVLLGATHGLGHLVVGRAMGIGFTAWFVGELKQPQPGVKVDYATYLRTPPSGRAWMHASGAIVTKLIPFAMIGAAVAAGLPNWTIWALVALGLAMVLTDILWSTKASDWSKFKREMAFAQSE